MCEFDEDLTNTITFTQYMRPDGHTKDVNAPIPDGMHEMVADLLAANSSFTCEVLTTSQVVMYCDIGSTGDDDAMEICSNGPAVINALASLIKNAWNKLNGR